jgi:hypothetical protein
MLQPGMKMDPWSGRTWHRPLQWPCDTVRPVPSSPENCIAPNLNKRTWMASGLHTSHQLWTNEG